MRSKVRRNGRGMRWVACGLVLVAGACSKAHDVVFVGGKKTAASGAGSGVAGSGSGGAAGRAGSGGSLGTGLAGAGAAGSAMTGTGVAGTNGFTGGFFGGTGGRAGGAGGRMGTGTGTGGPTGGGAVSHDVSGCMPCQSAMGFNGTLEACCSAPGVCGVDVSSITGQASCMRQNAPGTQTMNCPSGDLMGLFTIPGCCGADGICGLVIMQIAPLGCVHSDVLASYGITVQGGTTRCTELP